jgi:hypothetical protein
MTFFIVQPRELAGKFEDQLSIIGAYGVAHLRKNLPSLPCNIKSFLD